MLIVKQYISFLKSDQKDWIRFQTFVTHSLFIKINLHNIKVYTNHGCLEEESILGGKYGIDVSVWFDYTNAALTNHLSLIADYILLEEIVYRSMAIASRLIETVALWVYEGIELKFVVESAKIRITKINAPTGGQAESVSVEIEK